jgi:hypothetical protein
MTCTSLRFFPATSSQQTLSFTTDTTFNQINNELAPTPNPNLPDHGSLFKLDDPTTASSVTGQIFFDTPAFVDANNDGFDDFFQVGQSVPSTQSQGVFKTPVDQGTVTANWGRNAGSSMGTCTIQMTGQSFGQMPAFTFTFELLTYSGTLTYTAKTNGINSFLSVTNVETSTNYLRGPLSFVRGTGTNRFDNLTLLPGSLTNSSGQTLSYQVEDIGRDTARLTNYFGFFDFNAFDLSSNTPDYTDWIFSIDDTNDANGNGIPDFSDDPSASTVTSPSLSLANSNHQLVLNVTATVGQSYTLQETTSLARTNWQNTASITITNNPQAVLLPIPGSATAFWRLRAP